jgi:drug/metabolite transporter (DMT)-like permease
MLGASFFFALMAASAKWLSRDFSTVQQVFFRNLVGVTYVLVSIWQRPMRHKGGRLGLLVFRGVVGTVSLYLLFYAISTLGLGHAITYQYTYPIFLALFSWLLIGEKLNRREWGAILVGFWGILLVFRPDMHLSPKEHLIGLGNAILTSFAYMSIRQLGGYYDTRAIVLSFMLSGIVLPLISMGIGEWIGIIEGWEFAIGQFKWPNTCMQWFFILGLGISALIGQFMMTMAFQHGKAGQVAAVSYSNILFSLLLGILLGEGIPEIVVLCGIGLIITGGVMVARK